MDSVVLIKKIKPRKAFDNEQNKCIIVCIQLLLEFYYLYILEFICALSIISSLLEFDKMI